MYIHGERLPMAVPSDDPLMAPMTIEGPPGRALGRRVFPGPPSVRPMPRGRALGRLPRPGVVGLPIVRPPAFGLVRKPGRVEQYWTAKAKGWAETRRLQALTGQRTRSSAPSLPAPFRPGRWLSPYGLSGAMEQAKEAVDSGTEMIAQGTRLRSSGPFLGAIRAMRDRLIFGTSRHLPLRGMPIMAKRRLHQKLGIIPSPSIPGLRFGREPKYVTDVELIGFESAPVGSTTPQGAHDVHRASSGFLRSPLSR